jgi:hypothetical protein
MMSSNDQKRLGAAGAPSSAIRVRITEGPDDSVVGRIGYLFDFYKEGLKAYIVTVTDSEVRRLHLQDGYSYQVEEI